MRILLVEDDPRLVGVISRALRESSYAVDRESDGARAAERIPGGEFDLVILDIILPSMDGISICRRLRESGCPVPILMLSARAELKDRVRGLEVGADDYLAKPFALAELRARVAALLRRRALPPQARIAAGSLRLDRDRRRLEVRGRLVELSAKEFALLEFLLLNRGRVVSRAQIAEHVWDDGYEIFSNLIEVYVARLRRKIDSHLPENAGSFLRTLRGEGYVISDSDGR